MGFYEYIYQNKTITRKSNKIDLCKLNLENILVCKIEFEDIFNLPYVDRFVIFIRIVDLTS